MNVQQLLTLVIACAVLMLPLGMALGGLAKWAWRQVSMRMPPRHLRSAGQWRRQRNSPEERI